MDHPEGLGSASASEVPTCPPGPGYNFRPRSRSATAPKNRRLGSVEMPGAGSTLDLPNITPPNSPTPRGAGIPTHENIPTIISYDSATQPRAYNSTLIPDTVVVGPSSPCSTLMPNPIAAGVSSPYPTLMHNTVSPSLPNSTLDTPNSTQRLRNSTLVHHNSTITSSLPFSTHSLRNST